MGSWYELPDLGLVRTGLGRLVKLFGFFEVELEREEKKSRRVEMGVWGRAQAWGSLLDEGVVSSQAELARHLGVSRARVSEVMAVRSVPAPLRELLLNAEGTERPVTDRVWRRIRRLPPDAAAGLLREWGFR